MPSKLITQCPCLQRITDVSPMNGNVPINAASQKPGSVTRRMTVGITQMKTVPTVPAGSASQVILSAPVATASLRTGSVMWTMTVETTRMSPSMNAVSSCGRDMAWPGIGNNRNTCVAWERTRVPYCSPMRNCLLAHHAHSAPWCKEKWCGLRNEPNLGGKWLIPPLYTLLTICAYSTFSFELQTNIVR